jgi:hypothetical protein
VQATITNEGNVGYTHWKNSNDSLGIDSIGLGFVYTGNNYLFEAGLMVGTSQNQISDCVRNETGWAQDEDFVEEEETSNTMCLMGGTEDGSCFGHCDWVDFIIHGQGGSD